jgi:hypothetical protein
MFVCIVLAYFVCKEYRIEKKGYNGHARSVWGVIGRINNHQTTLKIGHNLGSLDQMS